MEQLRHHETPSVILLIPVAFFLRYPERGQFRETHSLWCGGSKRFAWEEDLR